jgi:parallel beta-helix repeat protein
LVEYNYVYHNLNGGGSGGVGIWLDSLAGGGSVVRYNLAVNNTQSGIWIEASTGASIYANVVSGGGGGTTTGIDIRSDDPATYPMNGTVVYNNTVYGVNGGGIGVIGDYGTAGGLTNTWVKNNVAVGNTGPNLAAFGGGENDGVSGYGNVYTYNDFGAQASDFIVWGGTGAWGSPSSYTYYSTYSTWEAAAGNCGTVGCSHSVESAPTFANSAAEEFWLTSGSPGIGAGVALGSPYNVGLLSGSTWPTGVTTGPTNTPPDIGAFVYVPSVAPPPNLQVVSVH